MCAAKPIMKIYKTGSGKIKRNSNIKTQNASIFFLKVVSENICQIASKIYKYKASIFINMC